MVKHTPSSRWKKQRQIETALDNEIVTETTLEALSAAPRTQSQLRQTVQTMRQLGIPRTVRRQLYNTGVEDGSLDTLGAYILDIAKEGEFQQLDMLYGTQERPLEVLRLGIDIHDVGQDSVGNMLAYRERHTEGLDRFSPKLRNGLPGGYESQHAIEGVARNLER